MSAFSSIISRDFTLFYAFNASTAITTSIVFTLFAIFYAYTRSCSHSSGIISRDFTFFYAFIASTAGTTSIAFTLFAIFYAYTRSYCHSASTHAEQYNCRFAAIIVRLSPCLFATLRSAHRGLRPIKIDNKKAGYVQARADSLLSIFAWLIAIAKIIR